MAKLLTTLLMLLALTACSVADRLPTRSESASTGTPLSVDSLFVDGPLEVAAYSALPLTQAFRSGTVYHPLEPRQRLGIVAVAPGLSESQRHINWWGPRLASHGYAVLILDTNGLRDDPEMRADALLAAVAMLKAEHSREQSPLFGRIDPARVAVMGHSLGGGGALLAANREGSNLQAVIPLTPWMPLASFEDIVAPTLIIAAENDQIAPLGEHAWPHYQSIPVSTPAVYVEMAEGDHFVANSGSPDLPSLGRFVVAWLKLYLDGDERYREFLYGEELDTGASRFSRYVIHP